MTKSRLVSRVLTIAVALGGGALVATTGSCGDQLRASVQSATMDFVKSSTSTIFQQLFPVKDMFANAT
jgi:hypothetical protein